MPGVAGPRAEFDNRGESLRCQMKTLIVFPLLTLCLAAAALEAQADTRGDVLGGRVTDVTGRPVADAQVGATALGSGITRSISTDAEGHYRLFFPRTARQYVVLAKRMGFAPVQRTITRRTSGPEEMTIDMQLGGSPLALSMVEVRGESDTPPARASDGRPAVDATVPNPVSEILALKDTLHLSAVQIIGLTDVADSLQTRNTRIYRNIRTLLTKSQEAGDVGQMAGSVAIMLEEASGNTARAVTAAEKLLRPEQWQILPQAIRDLLQDRSADTAKQ
ncbi:MAG: hypothetical protein DMD63_01240 [Gemmatimonadetes bacterium]|nr:MAG: hypothetical protein DMD63_01240 [Gemmatimonadota bacterium]